MLRPLHLTHTTEYPWNIYISSATKPYKPNTRIQITHLCCSLDGSEFAPYERTRSNFNFITYGNRRERTTEDRTAFSRKRSFCSTKGDVSAIENRWISEQYWKKKTCLQYQIKEYLYVLSKTLTGKSIQDPSLLLCHVDGKHQPTCEPMNHLSLQERYSRHVAWNPSTP